jgi:hypothetical protein
MGTSDYSILQYMYKLNMEYLINLLTKVFYCYPSFPLQARDVETGTLMAAKQISFCRNSDEEQDKVSIPNHVPYSDVTTVIPAYRFQLASLLIGQNLLTLFYWFADFPPNRDLSQVFSLHNIINLTGRQL